MTFDKTSSVYVKGYKDAMSIHENLKSLFSDCKGGERMENEYNSELVKIGYLLADAWVYEICTADAVVVRVSQLMTDANVKKISITKNYGI